MLRRRAFIVCLLAGLPFSGNLASSSCIPLAPRGKRRPPFALPIALARPRLQNGDVIHDLASATLSYNAAIPGGAPQRTPGGRI